MDNPLASVVVLTYNSSATVLETLDSIKDQTYEKIELIITDDASKDNTVYLCSEWIKNNSSRFVNTYLISSDVNLGTTANCNKGWKASSGDWVKLIAGDDRLLPNCISDNVSFIQKHKNAEIVFSKLRLFGNTIIPKKWICKDVGPFFRGLTQRQLAIRLYRGNFLPASSAWIKYSCLQKLGGYDEQFRLLEDWPFWMKAVSNGVKLWFLDKETVDYRFSENSVSNSESSESLLDSDTEKGIQLANEYIQQMGFGAWLFNKTKTLKAQHSWGYLLYAVNFINPFYYEYRKSGNLFAEIRKEVVEE